MGSRRRQALIAAMLTMLLTACGSGADDVLGGGANRDTGITLKLAAYAVPEPGWSKIIPAFTATPAGEGIEITTSYGASGDQSRSVADGKPADIVNFSVEPDVTRLVKANKVATGWSADVTKGIPFGSVVTLVVRRGNPKNIRGWNDLLQPGVEVVTPSPLSSGSAKWNLLAPYAATSNGGRDQRAGLDYLTELVGEHVKTRAASGREATEIFLQGTGDVLISYENEAINVERAGRDVEHVNPVQTFKIENPVAVVSTGPHLAQAVALKNFLFTPEGQKIWAQAGFRPVDPAVVAEFAGDFPATEKLWTIADLGGWATVDSALFDKENGAITAIYKRVAG